MDHAIYGGFAFLPDRTQAGTQWGDAVFSSGGAGSCFHYPAVRRHTRCERDQASRRPA
jgi:hypothetical protein